MSELIGIKCVDISNSKTCPLMLEVFDDDDNMTMIVEYSNKKYFSEGEFYFEVFQSLKDQLLEDNIGIQCYGSLINAHSSNMMGYVPKVYLLKMGEQAKLQNIVNFLDYVEIKNFATKKEQDEYYEVWIKSLNQYIFFYKTQNPFSQWYPCYFEINNILFNCAEQWMMYSKALVFGDERIANLILETKEPRIHKELGRKVENFTESIWNKKAKEIVYKGNYAKFSQNKDLKDVLLNTGDKILVEASPHDTIWGVGLSEDNPDIYDPKKWKGTNYLGKILMQVREDLTNNK